MLKTSKVLLLACLALLLAAFYALDLGRYLSLDYLKSSHVALAGLYAQHPEAVRAVYFLVYVAVAAASLPGAAILTLAGGTLFGLGWGLVLVSFASSVGATLAFLMARYVLRDSLQARFRTRLADIDRGIARDGALYLLGLRLVPLVPFFVINLAMGLTAMRVWTFYWVSQVGMLAGTAVYVNAGTQLAQIHALHDVLSPAMLASFILLGLFPLLARAATDAVQKHKAYRRWRGQRPKTFDRNMVVIGAGAGGLVTAYIAAAVKARVTLVEAHTMGGDCLNYGCVPSKALIRSARLAHEMRHGAQFGLRNTEPAFSFQEVMQRVHAVIAAIAPNDSAARYTNLGVDVMAGHATITSPWTVEVNTGDGSKQVLTTRSIVIATGSRPIVPPLPGLDAVGCVTSDTMWSAFAQLDQAPKRLVVLGGGPIGCELAQSFARLGSTVYVVEQAAQLLSREDEDVAKLVAAALRADGVRLLTGHTAVRCELRSTGTDTEKCLVVENDGTQQHIVFDQLLCAVGRAARLDGYGLEAMGIPTQQTVQTNAYLQTIYPNIYAVGDVAGPFQFTHTAAHQAWYAAVNALFGDFKKFKVDYSVIPCVTFTDPEVARVGLNERDAGTQGIAFECTQYNIGELDRQLCDGPANADAMAQGFVKILTVPGKDTILGVTIVGAHAGDLLAEFVLAMQHGLGLNKILGTIHSYPTMAEANKYAAGEWKRAHQPRALLRWVRNFHDWRRGSP